MGNLIRPQVKIESKDGECKILLEIEININLNGDGVTSLIKEKNKTQEEDIWPIPEFTSKEKVKFGRKE